MKITRDINPTGMASAYIQAPFDKAKQALESEGYKIISLERNAQLRIQQGKDSYISRNGNWVKEGFLILPNDKFYLTKLSPIMENPKEATKAHKNGQEFYLNDNQIQESLEDSVKITDRKIPTKRFGENQLTVYTFGEQAEDYGLFLQDANIEEMPIWLPNSEDKAFSRPLWFWSLGGRSYLCGDDWDLCYGYRMRGVQEDAVGVAKTQKVYTSKQIQKALKTLNIKGLEKDILDVLRR